MTTSVFSPKDSQSIESSKFADIIYMPDDQTVVISTKVEYLPMENFREIFNKLTVFFEQNKVSKLIFDKRSLRVFHQPSMEWYYKDWKTVMLQKHGLRNHYKLLPKDSLFIKSVEIGRNKILSETPESSPLHQLNILYFDSLSKALEA